MPDQTFWLASTANGKPMGNRTSYDMAVDCVKKQGSVVKRVVSDGITQFQIKDKTGSSKIYFVVRQT